MKNMSIACRIDPGLLSDAHFSGAQRVYSIIEAAGWPIWPLILCSVIALAIIEMWSLRASVVMPRHLLEQVVQEIRQNGLARDDQPSRHGLASRSDFRGGTA